MMEYNSSKKVFEHLALKMIYAAVYMCYSTLTFKGTSPVINEPYKFFYLKVTGETKMRQNMDMNLNEH